MPDPADPRTGNAPRRRPRLNPFERVQLLLVAWVALTDPLSIGAGLQMFPNPADRQPDAPSVSAAVALLRVLNAATYPLLAFLATRRFPLWTRGARHAAVHLLALAGAHAVAWACAGMDARLGFGGTFYLHRTLEYVVYAVFAHGMLYGERFHEKEREELRLRAGMAESTAERTRAQLRVLRMEWSPRFLTGTLESIGELLARDVAAAKRMLLGLSTVLRRTLAHGRLETVRLEQEVELVREVLAVEGMRRPRLAVEWAVDEAALEVPVPHLSVLPLVYQALGEDAACRLRIHAAPTETGVAVRVEAFRSAPGVEAWEVRREAVLAAEPAGPAATAAVADEAVPAPGGAASPAPPPAQLGRRFELGTYAALLALYTLLAVYSAYAQVQRGGVALAGPAWVYVAGAGAYAALWWGSLAAAARYLSARFPLRQRKWGRRLAVHTAGALAVALLNAVAYLPFQYQVVRSGAISIGLGAYWEWGDLTVYPLLAGIAHGFLYAREYHTRHLSQLRLRSQLSESELARTTAHLQALRAELNPHFLFNALNTVSSLMHGSADQARRVVAHLSALLRRVLESSAAAEATVEEEVEIVRLYVEIEQARFGDALRVVYDLEAGALAARVPHLLVQPLVENAIKHGLRPRGGTGTVTLAARRDGGWLRLEVADDGVGLAHAPPGQGTGTGLANVRQRLRQLYGDQHALELVPGPEGGTVARIRIPFSEASRTAPPAATALAAHAG
jgi:sensor histidine kinase YesM